MCSGFPFPTLPPVRSGGPTVSVADQSAGGQPTAAARHHRQLRAVADQSGRRRSGCSSDLRLVRWRRRRRVRHVRPAVSGRLVVRQVVLVQRWRMVWVVDVGVVVVVVAVDVVVVDG